MATPTTIPAGWVRDGNNGYYSAEFRSVTKNSVNPGANPNLNYTYSVNPQTGDRIVYANAPQVSTGLQNQVTGQYFNVGGSRIPVMSIDSSGNVTKLSGYEQIKSSYGNQGLVTLQNNSKGAASNLMSKTGTSDAVKNSSEFKSSLSNASPLNKDTQKAGGSSENGGFDSSKMKDINVSIGDNPGTRGSYGNYKYPKNLDLKIQDCMRFSMLKYSAKPLSSSKISEGTGFAARSGTEKRLKDAIGSTILPIQGAMDTNTVDWAGSGINPMQAMGASASADMITGGIGQGAAASGQDLVKLVGNSKSDIQKALAVHFAGEAVGAQNLLSRTSGAILNPNLELLFNGPQLRQFSFTFRMTPRFKEEAEEVRKIIRFFKQGMSVKRGKSELFLKAPNTFLIQYLNNSKDHPYIGKIKECALLSCTVNYVPDQTYMTFSEIPSMTAYEMSLTFSELEPIYDDEYGDEDSVGF